MIESSALEEGPIHLFSGLHTHAFPSSDDMHIMVIHEASAMTPQLERIDPDYEQFLLRIWSCVTSGKSSIVDYCGTTYPMMGVEEKAGIRLRVPARWTPSGLEISIQERNRGVTLIPF